MKTLLVLFSLSTAIVFGQTTTSEIHYSAPGIYLSIVIKSVEDSRKPLGKDVSITYDTFFKSYQIFYIDEDGVTNSLHLEYLNDEKNADNIPEYRMKDSHGNIYFVLNMLSTGLLKILIPKEYPEGKIAWIRIENAKISQIPSR